MLTKHPLLSMTLPFSAPFELLNTQLSTKKIILSCLLRCCCMDLPDGYDSTLKCLSLAFPIPLLPHGLTQGMQYHSLFGVGCSFLSLFCLLCSCFLSSVLLDPLLWAPFVLVHCPFLWLPLFFVCVPFICWIHALLWIIWPISQMFCFQSFDYSL